MTAAARRAMISAKIIFFIPRFIYFASKVSVFSLSKTNLFSSFGFCAASKKLFIEASNDLLSMLSFGKAIYECIRKEFSCAFAKSAVNRSTSENKNTLNEVDEIKPSTYCEQRPEGATRIARQHERRAGGPTKQRLLQRLCEEIFPLLFFSLGDNEQRGRVFNYFYSFSCHFAILMAYVNSNVLSAHFASYSCGCPAPAHRVKNRVARIGP